MKIAHISDLHINTFFSNSNLKAFNYLLKYALEQKFDHLVITGDLTDNAVEKDFEILRKIFKRNGLLNSERMSLVIGNHDIFGGIQFAEEIFNFPERCQKINYETKVIEFVEYFKETFSYCNHYDDNIFPYSKVINNVLLIGINSIAKYSRMKNPFASNGEVKLKELLLIKKIMESNSHIKNKIALIHHHFNKLKVNNSASTASVWQNIEKQTMKLKKKKRILNLFNENKIDLVLHGHIHENKEYLRKGIRFLNGGASIKNLNSEEMNINFININKDLLQIEIHKILSNTPVIINKKLSQPEETEENLSFLSDVVNF